VIFLNPGGFLDSIHLKTIIRRKKIYLIIFWVLLTSAFRTLVNDSKNEIIDKFYVEKTTF